MTQWLLTAEDVLGLLLLFSNVSWTDVPEDVGLLLCVIVYVDDTDVSSLCAGASSIVMLVGLAKDS